MAVPQPHGSSPEQALRRKHLPYHDNTGLTGHHTAIHENPMPTALQAHVPEPMPPGSKLPSRTSTLHIAPPLPGQDDHIMAGRNGVHRPSLDGRNRKVPATLVGKDDWPRPQLLQSREPVNLREASPPKTNPWSRTTKPTSPISNDSTLGTPDSALWPTPDNNRGPPSAKSPPPKADTEPAECCREESPASNPSSENKTSGAVLEASKAAAAALSEHGLRNGQPEDENEKRNDWQEYLKTPPSFATKHVRYWLWKTGACADVILHLDDKTYFCHREILTAESGYFRDNLPPPTSVCGKLWCQGNCKTDPANQSGVPVEVALVTHGSLNSHCLRFLYTGRKYFLKAHGDSPTFMQDVDKTPKSWRWQSPDATSTTTLPSSPCALCFLFRRKDFGLPRWPATSSGSWKKWRRNGETSSSLHSTTAFGPTTRPTLSAFTFKTRSTLRTTTPTAPPLRRCGLPLPASSTPCSRSLPGRTVPLGFSRRASGISMPDGSRRTCIGLDSSASRSTGSALLKTKSRLFGSNARNREACETPYPWRWFAFPLSRATSERTSRQVRTRKCPWAMARPQHGRGVWAFGGPDYRVYMMPRQWIMGFGLHEQA